MWRLYLQVHDSRHHSRGCKYRFNDNADAKILEQPISTPRIAKSVESILELCSEATAMRMSVMLTWPLLIAGLYCLPEIREKVSSLFDAFQYDYCEDLRVAVSYFITIVGK